MGASVKSVLTDLMETWTSGGTSALATLVRTEGSAPRQPGAAMTVTEDDGVSGSISGGCIDGAVYELAREILAGAPPSLHRFDGGDGVFEPALICGGSLEVFLEPVSNQTFAELASVHDDIVNRRPVAVATVIESVDRDRVARRLIVRPLVHVGSLGDKDLDATVARGARACLEAGTSTVLTCAPDPEHGDELLRVFVEVHQPPARLIVFGAVDFAEAVARQGALLGFWVTVCDARAIFATAARFPDVDELVVSWPDRYLRSEVEAGRIDHRTAICVLTHDAKFDVPLLEVALALQGENAPGFIGALGSVATHRDRVARLKSVGVPSWQLAKLSSPIGLDLGGLTPEETALSILAEVIALRRGGTGGRLTGSGRPVHRVAGSP